MHLPAALAPVVRLAYNLRWVWSHATDRLWETMDAVVWLQTRNPILVLQNTPRSRLDELVHDPGFVERVRRLDRREYRVQVYLGEIPPESVAVELCAESRGDGVASGTPCAASGR